MKKRYIVEMEDGHTWSPHYIYSVKEYRSPFEMITEFHNAYGHPAPSKPTLLDPVHRRLRIKLHYEECIIEYMDAVEKQDIAEIADALCDSVYVIVGSAVSHGFTQFDKMFAEAHRSNMSKLGADGKPIYRDDGKVLKGPNFTPPNLLPFLK